MDGPAQMNAASPAAAAAHNVKATATDIFMVPTNVFPACLSKHLRLPRNGGGANAGPPPRSGVCGGAVDYVLLTGWSSPLFSDIVFLTDHGTQSDSFVYNQGLCTIRHIISFLLFGLSVIFGYFYYAQYFKWRDCFNEAGRCFDRQSGVVYMEQSGIAWIILTLLTFGAFVFCLWSSRPPKSE